MAGLVIQTFPNSILRKKARRVIKVTEDERVFLCDMAQTMYLNSGVGLAATQVGIDKQLAVIDIGQGLLKFINPDILKKEGVQTEEEGCLSVPQTYVKVKRAKKVTVGYLNEDGQAMQILAEGLLARAIQHEVDHLSGKLIVDYLGPIKRLLMKRQRRCG